ncbi:MAG: hypothetical protein KME20_23845 [Kaiparowitsia implicata GSE-PSE-MK54-09C]|jgi:flagellar basal body-associated protein FliL|nr:hypothetical protein [Kaiparowitsia implicata GSE-PSE-MK54-09C]
MRYSIMLQLVLMVTVVMVATSAMFAWLQSRPSDAPDEPAEQMSRRIEFVLKLF